MGPMHRTWQVNAIVLLPYSTTCHSFYVWFLKKLEEETRQKKNGRKGKEKDI